MKTQPAAPPYEKDLVLVGGGHSHALVLLRLSMAPLSGVRVTLISESSTSPYSGMLPGLVAGHYEPRDVYVDLRKLCHHASVRFIQARVCGIDPNNKRVILEGRPPVEYDVVSINAGITPEMQADGAAEYAVPVKPIATFWPRWQTVSSVLLQSGEPRNIAVIGGGAGSVELALAMAHRLRSAPVRHRISLVIKAEDVVKEYPARMRRWLYQRLQRDGIQVHTQFAVTRVTATHIENASGQFLEADHVFWCTQARAAAWLEKSGLAVTPQGFLRVHPTLQSISHQDVFAAGDCAWLEGHSLPRAGVYAVRQAPVLQENLARHLRGQALQTYRPQSNFLSLLACGDKDAVGAKGRFSLAGAWVWHWKDRIDRRFMHMFHSLPVMPPPRQEEDQSLEPPAARCGGCGAKVGADILKQALIGLSESAPDDAAIIILPNNTDTHDDNAPVLVQSVDALKPLFDDPYLFARLATLHALSDLFAMHATPHSAQLLLEVPILKGTLQLRDLRQLLPGVQAELEQHGATLIGGHTLEGDNLQVGLNVNGFAHPQQLLRKRGVCEGDVLILTKPLGTGAIFSAAMRGAAEAAWIDQAIASMQVSNAYAADIFAQQGAHALTDVTGFGLLGHLAEMLQATNLRIMLKLSAVPVLEGALECIRRGYQSTLSPANRRVRHAFQLQGVSSDDPRYQLLFDPQTSGGLLASLPQTSAYTCLEALHAAGITAAAVGKCTSHEINAQGGALWMIAE